MKATVRIYITEKLTKKGFPIKLEITNLGKRKRKNIAFSFSRDWDFANELPLKSHPNFIEYYSLIKNIRVLSGSVEFMNMDSIERAFYFLLSKKKQVDFYVFAEKRIEFMINQGRIGNSMAYKSAVKSLKKFKPELYYNDINANMLEQFKVFLKMKNVKISNSTIRTYLKELRAIYNSCSKLNGLNNNFPFRGLMSDLPVKNKRRKNVYILKSEFKKIRDVKGLSDRFQRVADLVLLRFYLCGLDLVDLYFLKNSQIVNDRLYLSRTKLGERADVFDVKIFKPAKEIINKYSNESGEYVFPWRKDRTGYVTFRSNHNRDVSILFKMLKIEVRPLSEKFTTKSVRHSFATIAKFEMIDVDIIRELMGHERNDIDTIYKDLYPEKVRDDAHFKIITLN